MKNGIYLKSSHNLFRLLFELESGSSNSNELTFCGKISAVIINGSGRMPKQLINTNVEKLANGIQLTPDKSNPE